MTNNTVFLKDIPSFFTCLAQGKKELRVMVYFNLHRHVWSIRALEGPYKRQVIAHVEGLCLSEAIPKVSEAGRQRVLKTRSKNVHAGIVGLWDGTIVDSTDCKGREITYNPYLYSTFVYKDDKSPFTTAEKVLMLNKKVYRLA